VLLFANPSIPQVGMGRPTTGLAQGPGPSQWGDPVGLLPPQNELYVGVSLHTARIILRCPERHPFLWRVIPHPTRPPARVGSRARKRAPTARGTMTNRVRHGALFIPNPGWLSFSEGAGRSLRPCHYRQVVLGRIPLPAGGRGPPISFDVEGPLDLYLPPDSIDQ
jgi:hypothetical protein